MSVPTAPTYEALLARVQPRVIHDAREHARQLAEADRIMTEYSRAPCPAYEEMIDLLLTLISRYKDPSEQR